MAVCLMIERFSKPAGDSNLRNAIQRQKIVQHDLVVAEKLISKGTLIEYAAQQTIIQQNSADEFVYFILSGAVDIHIKGRVIARRSQDDTVGEMVAADPGEPRSATAVTTVETVVLRVPASDFVKIAQEHSGMWRALCSQLGTRLRELNRFHHEPNVRPILFVGSSVEGSPIARHIQLGLKHEPVTVDVWANGVFGPSGVTVDELLDEVQKVDFAVFVFGPDDKISSRGSAIDAPRDNVVFELGLFLSRLGRKRTFIVREQSAELKIPSDLLGINPITYIANKNSNLENVLGTVCTEISNRIRKVGPI